MTVRSVKAAEPATAAVVIIGNEILSGRTQDSNLAYLGTRLGELGISLAEARVIRDVQPEIVAAVNSCRSAYRYVFTTGGIGPTHDDITTSAVAAAFGLPIEENAEAARRLREYYGDSKLNEARMQMAHLPVSAVLIDNPISHAPGFQLDNVFVLPGVPMIMRAMFEGILDRLQHGPPVLAKVITTDLREGDFATQLGRLQVSFPNVTIGSYPMANNGRLSVKLVLRGIDANDLAQAVAVIEQLLQTLGGTVSIE